MNQPLISPKIHHHHDTAAVVPAADGAAVSNKLNMMFPNPKSSSSRSRSSSNSSMSSMWCSSSFMDSLPYDYVFVKDLNLMNPKEEKEEEAFLYDKNDELRRTLMMMSESIHQSNSMEEEFDDSDDYGSEKKEKLLTEESKSTFQTLIRGTAGQMIYAAAGGGKPQSVCKQIWMATTTTACSDEDAEQQQQEEEEELELVEELWDIILFPIKEEKQNGKKRKKDCRNITVAMGGLIRILEKRRCVAEGGAQALPTQILKDHHHHQQQQQHQQKEKEIVLMGKDHDEEPTSIGARKHEKKLKLDLEENNNNTSCTTHTDEQCVQLLLKHLPIAYTMCEVVWDEDGTEAPIDYVTLDVNDYFEEMTGLTRELLVGKRVREALPGIEKDPGDWIKRFGKVVREDSVDHYTQYSEKFGRWFAGTAFKYGGSSGSSKFVVFFADQQDATIRLKDKIREIEERHLTLFENMKQGVVYHKADGSTMAANNSALRILGVSMDQMLGKLPMDPQWRFCREDGSTLPIEEYPAVVALSGQPVTGMTMGVYNTQEQGIRWVTLDAMPRFRPGEDKPYQAYTIFNDITEAKEIERSIICSKQKAEEADQLKSAFLACMSHEIRTPLNGIIGSLDLILSNDLQSEYRVENLEGLHTAMKSANLLIAIIQDVLDLSKIEAGQLDIVEHPISIRSLIEDTVRLADSFRIQKRKGDVKLISEVVDVDGDDSIVDRIYGDQYRIQQVLNNLLSNAVKFSDVGPISLSIRRVCDDEADVLEFCVQDNGKGIPEDRLETIFEPFRQVEFGDTRKHGGTGLGLTICKKLCDLMGGVLRVESKVDHGTRFTFTLPYRPAPLPTNEEEEEMRLATLRTAGPTRWTTYAYSTCSNPLSDDTSSSNSDRPGSPLLAQQQQQQRRRQEATPTPNQTSATPSAAPGSNRRRRRRNKILIADDDDISRKIAVRMLQKGHTGEILQAVDGLEAVDLFQRHRDDIGFVLIDCMMPNVDGLEATRRIRAIEEEEWEAAVLVGGGDSSRDEEKVPIVALSAGAMKGDKERGLAVGMSDYLYKPVNRKELLMTLENYMPPKIAL